MTNKTVTYKSETIPVKWKLPSYPELVKINSGLLSQDDISRCALTKTFALGTLSLRLYISVMLDDIKRSDVLDLVTESLSLYVQGEIPSSLADEISGLALTLSVLLYGVQVSISFLENDLCIFIL